jgi:hypothetical protein
VSPYKIQTDEKRQYLKSSNLFDNEFLVVHINETVIAMADTLQRVHRQPIANTINLVLVCSYRDQQRHEVGFKKTAEEPDINDKDWPRTLEKIREYLASQYGIAGATLYYVVRPDIAVKPEAEDPAEGYETVDQEMMARAPQSFVDDRRKVWYAPQPLCHVSLSLHREG